MSLWSYICGYVLIFLRYYVALHVLRFLRAFLPAGASTIVAFSLAVGVTPFVVVQQCARLLETGGSFDILLYILRELCIGLSLSLPLAIVCESFSLAGRIADTSRGAQLAEQLVPALEERVSPLEHLMGLGTALFVLKTGSFQSLVALLAMQPQVVPTGGWMSFQWNLSDIISNGFLNSDSLLLLSAKAILLGFLIASPVLLILWCIDISAMFLMKTLSRINIIQEIIPLKLILGIFVFAWSITNSGESSLGIFREVLMLCSARG